VDPEGFLEEGYLDAALRRALSLGVPPPLAYQMVTINVAEHFHLDHLIGSLAPGRSADLVMIPSPDRYDPRLVMCRGKILFRNGETLAHPARVAFPEWMFHTVEIPDYMIPPLPSKGKVRVAELVTRLVTRERILDLDAPGDSDDLVLALALNRRGGNEAFPGLLKGFGLQRGAVGSTMCWDTLDLVVVGHDPRSMRTVVGRLKELGGGAVFAIGEEIVAEFPAPLCGVLSLEPMEVARDQVRNLEEALRRNGVPWEKPLLTVDTLATAAIPHMRLTHRGYVKLRDRTLLPVEV
jgi:adenine deaminase